VVKDSVPIGASAVRLGYVEPNDVDNALHEQDVRKKEKGQQVILGMLMVEMGLLTNDQLASVLTNQSIINALPLSEDAMRLAARFRAILEDQQKVLLFCSCREQEGVSSVASGVAIALALMGMGDVLMIDANTRSLEHTGNTLYYNTFGIEKGNGLCELLAGTASVDEAIKTTSMPSFSILPVGNGESDILSLLISGAYSRQMEKLRERFAFIIIDAPPLLEYPDTGLLAAHADGVAMVIATGKRNLDEIIDAKRILNGLDVAILGSIITEMASRKPTKQG
jgi:capsular exopolysaccharide synthesis family protein